MASLSTPFRGWKKKAVVLLLPLAPAAWALVYPRVADIKPAAIDEDDEPAGNHSKTLLLARQDASIGGGTPMGLDCLYLCTLATCGAGSCPLEHRGLRYPDLEARSEGNVTSGLRKRVFTKDETGWTAKQIDEYMTENLGFFRPFSDNQFPATYEMLINPFTNEATVAKEEKMADGEGKAFQIGTNMVHGCTVVAIISNRAVWMAHFWEVSAMGGLASPEMWEGSVEQKNFRERVINPITGAKPMVGVINPLTRNLYNQATDQTRVFIYTPLRHDWTSTQGIGPHTWLYMHRINEIKAAIQQTIGDPMIEVIPYFRMNYQAPHAFIGGVPTYFAIGDDAHLLETSARGSIMFQYDGTSEGRYWRLFIEHWIFRKGDLQGTYPRPTDGVPHR